MYTLCFISLIFICTCNIISFHIFGLYKSCICSDQIYVCMYVIKGFRWEKRGESQLRIHDVKLNICHDNKIYLNEPDEVLGFTCLK